MEDMEEIKDDRAAIQECIKDEQALLKEIAELEAEAEKLEAERARRLSALLKSKPGIT